jgi:hypothetical protein
VTLASIDTLKLSLEQTSLGARMGDNENSHTGGPSQRNGINWVDPCKGRSDMKRFVQRFQMQAEMFLSEEVYTVKKKRDIAYLNALLHAATLGNFTEVEGQQQKACRDCGFTTCKSLQPGQGKAACKAHETGQTCNYCGREGHFASTCRIKAKEAAKGGRVHAALAASVGF